MIKSWIEDVRNLWKKKSYCLALSLTAILSYGYLITHQTVGIDDTPYAYYFEEGLAAIVGRWVMFVLNKFVHIADFAPFVTELAAVLIFMAAVSVWCVLMKRILGDRIPDVGYLLFSCLFLSNPLLSEVFPYYLHNGVATGYLFCGISLCCFWEAVNVRGSGRIGLLKNLKYLGLSAVSLWIAVGCYESFMIVYLTAVCIVLCSARMAQGRTSRRRAECSESDDQAQDADSIVPVSLSLCKAAAAAIAAIILRSVAVSLITAVFGLQYLQDDAVHRSLTEMIGWMLEPGALSEFAMILKRVYVMYGVFGLAYYPIGIYVLAAAAAAVVSIRRSIRKKDPWIFILMIGSFIASYLLVLIEGKATLYRSAQFLPLYSAWGCLMAVMAVNAAASLLHKKKLPRVGRFLQRLIVFILCVILWNQCTDMNKWFYVDDLKYEDAKNTMNQISYELEKNFDCSKPIVFTGTYKIPKSIIEDAYVEYGSGTYHLMHRLTDFVDEHLLEKFYREYGVWVAQTPSLSVLDWGRYAFDNDEELIRFFTMHGHRFKPLLNTELYAPAEEYSLTLPSFPQEGSIVDMGDYIIVHF